MEKAYKFRIYPTEEQQVLLQKTFGCCRFVYNKYLDKRIKAYTTDKLSLNYNDCSAKLTELKNELEWLKEVDSTALQSTLKNLDMAYQNFFRRVKGKENPGFPKFKSKHSRKKSFTSKKVGNNIAVLDDRIKLPKLGYIKATVSKHVEGRIVSATVSQNPSGKYFVSLCCTEAEIPQYDSTNKTIGLDMGLTDFCITSEGQTFTNHKYLSQSKKKLAKLQRKLSKKTKGSNNYNKGRVKVARLHEHIANQRSDMLHKLSTQLVKNYDVICIEDLQVSKMIKTKRLAYSISDTSWSEFHRQLAYKCEWQHKALVKVDKFYPSSQICSYCGTQNPITKDLCVRSWTCQFCHTQHNRDINASINIHKEGLRLLRI